MNYSVRHLSLLSLLFRVISLVVSIILDAIKF